MSQRLIIHEVDHWMGYAVVAAHFNNAPDEANVVVLGDDGGSCDGRLGDLYDTYAASLAVPVFCSLHRYMGGSGSLKELTKVSAVSYSDVCEFANLMMREDAIDVHTSSNLIAEFIVRRKISETIVGDHDDNAGVCTINFKELVDALRQPFDEALAVGFLPEEQRGAAFDGIRIGRLPEISARQLSRGQREAVIDVWQNF